jgi:hypothetical protein
MGRETRFRIHANSWQNYVTDRYFKYIKLYYLFETTRGQATRGGPPAWWLGGDLPLLTVKKKACYDMLHRDSDKMDMTFRTWNVRSL